IAKRLTLALPRGHLRRTTTMLALPRKSHVFSLILAFARVLLPAALLPAALGSSASAEPAPRYPFDPLCPWGRLADGHGMILRCIQAEEASALAARAALPAPASAAEPNAVPPNALPSSGAAATAPSAVPPSAVPPSAQASSTLPP